MTPDAPKDPLGKRALFSGTVPEAPEAQAPRTDERRALFSEAEGGTLTVHCETCGERTPLSLVAFALQHFPAWFWLPWRRYSHFIRCPACGRFAWHAVDLTT